MTHRILHILTRENDPLPQDIVRLQQNSDTTVEVVDLTRPHTDYRALLESIFSADAVDVW